MHTRTGDRRKHRRGAAEGYGLEQACGRRPGSSPSASISGTIGTGLSSVRDRTRRPHAHETLSSIWTTGARRPCLTHHGIARARDKSGHRHLPARISRRRRSRLGSLPPHGAKRPPSLPVARGRRLPDTTDILSGPFAGGQRARPSALLVRVCRASGQASTGKSRAIPATGNKTRFAQNAPALPTKDTSASPVRGYGPEQPQDACRGKLPERQATRGQRAKR